MPFVERPGGARIRYEVTGQGYPLLCFAPGGVSSQVEFWDRSVIKPHVDFSDEFMVIRMDQRNAGQSFAPLEPVSYELAAADQVAILDDLGIERAHVMGGCIGVAYCLRIIHDAPGRISAAVCQDPVGLDETNNVETFWAMFRPTMKLARESGIDAVIASAQENPLFVMNNSGGPFAPRIAAEASFREEVRALGAEGYVDLVEAFARGMWPDNPPYFSVDASWVPTCPAPLLVLPGSDPFHPTGVAHRICREAPNAACLDVDCRSDEKLERTKDAIRAFLRDNAP